MNKREKLENLNKKWEKNCVCKLRKTAIQAVFGIGNPNADIVFIGEAPGKNEDLKGEPFIGTAGKFLNEMLEKIKMSREDIYITNIVKYRPPDNRDPTPKEIEDCREWLENQLNLIDPKIIVFLGRHALQHFFPKEKIGEAHGKLLKRKFTNINTQNFFALYHPAAALYNGRLRSTLIRDFKKLPGMIKAINN